MYIKEKHNIVLHIRKKLPLSRQACFVIAYSSGDNLLTRIFITIIIYYKNYITTAAENLNVQVFSCYMATLCFCGGKKIQVRIRYVC